MQRSSEARTNAPFGGGIAADLLDPPKVASVWICDREECDGEPHRGWPQKHARDKQRPPPGDWFVWLIMAGRGWGKSLTGGHWLAREALAGKAGDEFAVIGRTKEDTRNVCLEGSTGLLRALGLTKESKEYNATTGRIILPNGAKILAYTAERPDGVRGPNFSAVWADELASWRYFEIWYEGVIPATRIGKPRIVVTTTPKPVELIREWLKRDDDSVHVTRGATWENEANLSPEFLAEMERSLPERLLRQEMYGELIEDVEGALWTRELIDRSRVTEAPELSRIVVAIDPAVTSGENSDKTGIIVAGKGTDGHAYILDNLTGRYSPEAWARKAIAAYDQWGADRIIGEVNNGGDMIEMTLRTVRPEVPYKAVRATKGKQTRAEPIAALYGSEKHPSRVHHVGALPELEDDMTTWVQGDSKSPDAMDAMVWALTELMITGNVSLGKFIGAGGSSRWGVGTQRAY